MENPHTNYGDKKPWGLRPTNLNPLFKLHKFAIPFSPKDSLNRDWQEYHK